MDEEEILTPPEAAALLRIHPKTLYVLMRQGKVPAYRIGRAWRLKRSELLGMVGKVSDKDKPEKPEEPKRDVGSIIPGGR